jgi:hypothetical protein
MEPALEHSPMCAEESNGHDLGTQAVRLARMAVAVHMDQAARLRALVASVPPRPFVPHGSSQGEQDQ